MKMSKAYGGMMTGKGEMKQSMKGQIMKQHPKTMPMKPPANKKYGSSPSAKKQTLKPSKRIGVADPNFLNHKLRGI